MTYPKPCKFSLKSDFIVECCTVLESPFLVTDDDGLKGSVILSDMKFW